MYAHLYNRPKALQPTGFSHTLTIARDVESRDVVTTYAVNGKREARALCAQYGARAWNF